MGGRNQIACTITTVSQQLYQEKAGAGILTGVLTAKPKAYSSMNYLKDIMFWVSYVKFIMKDMENTYPHEKLDFKNDWNYNTVLFFRLEIKLWKEIVFLLFL